MKRDLATSVTLSFQDDDLFSVPAYQYVRIMGANDDLTLLFQLRQDLDHDIPDETLVEVVFRLVDHQRCRFGECDQRQHRAGTLARRPLVHGPSVEKYRLV